eukprot:3907267-Prymnesium_polylepis.2
MRANILVQDRSAVGGAHAVPAWSLAWHSRRARALGTHARNKQAGAVRTRWKSESLLRCGLFVSVASGVMCVLFRARARGAGGVCATTNVGGVVGRVGWPGAVSKRPFLVLAYHSAQTPRV